MLSAGKRLFVDIFKLDLCNGSHNIGNHFSCCRRSIDAVFYAQKPYTVACKLLEILCCVAGVSGKSGKLEDKDIFYIILFASYILHHLAERRSVFGVLAGFAFIRVFSYDADVPPLGKVSDFFFLRIKREAIHLYERGNTSIDICVLHEQLISFP